MATSKKGIDEERIAAASYILNFYQDVVNLTHNYCNYENVLIELQQEHGSTEEVKLSVEQKELIKQYCQILRYYARSSNIRYKAIIRSIKSKKIKERKELKELLKKINSNYVIRVEDIKAYVEVMNEIIVDNIIKNLLESSSSIVNDLYGGADSE